MMKTLCTSAFLLLISFSSILTADLEYEIKDIDTLQTHSSHPIAINNQGQILGWFNIDGTNNGKHFFVRNQDGSFHDVLSKENGIGNEINWRYLTNAGKAYGTFDGNKNFSVLYVWDEKSGVVKLGDLPGKEISAINDLGQVLIKSIIESVNGQSIRRPVIWHNGMITRLKGLEGELGIESEESYGFDMNNKGEVVGQSVAYLSYKNNIYKQTHATKWANGQAIDLHNTIPKTDMSYALAINDVGDILINRGHDAQLNNLGYVLQDDSVWAINKSGHIVDVFKLNSEILKDFNSIWMRITKLIDLNDNGEIVAEGETIYGEKHAMLLCPVQTATE